MNHKRIHPVSSFLVLLVVLVLGAGGAMAPVQAAHEVSAPDLAPQATTVVLDGTPAVYKVTSTSGSGSSSNISFAHTTGTGSNRLLLVGVSYNANNNVSPVSSVTFTYGGGPC